jgi:hypothetical protein
MTFCSQATGQPNESFMAANLKRLSESDDTTEEDVLNVKGAGLAFSLAGGDTVNTSNIVSTPSRHLNVLRPQLKHLHSSWP